jgi:hypothetical protein
MLRMNSQRPTPDFQRVRIRLGVGSWWLGVVAALLLGANASAQQEMPDPSLIHGRAIPAPELPNGTVTVRVVREALGNNAPGEEVRVVIGNATRRAKTDDLGRAEFRDLPREGEARAEATVDGEAMTSQPFAVPETGGLRVILVAGLARAAERKKQEEAAAAAAPAIKGVVVLGGDTRIVMEFDQDRLFGFYLLEIVNNARNRVDTGGPLIIDLPKGAAGARVREGSSPSASVNGDRLTIRGPFASGTTPVQVEFSLRYDAATYPIVQTFPVALQRVVVGVEKVGNMAMTSPQFATVTDLPTENAVYLLGQGPALPAGTPLNLTLSNLPVHSAMPRYVAVALALGIAGFGAWLAVGAQATRARERLTLTNRRDTLLAELAQLEAKRRDGTIAADKYAARRQRLVNELEQIYAELDEASAGPQGGGEGVPA